jgi:hypothetical protein
VIQEPDFRRLQVGNSLSVSNSFSNSMDTSIDTSDDGSMTMTAMAMDSTDDEESVDDGEEGSDDAEGGDSESGDEGGYLTLTTESLLSADASSADRQLVNGAFMAMLSLGVAWAGLA